MTRHNIAFPAASMKPEAEEPVVFDFISDEPVKNPNLTMISIRFAIISLGNHAKAQAVTEFIKRPGREIRE
jgi:hypothetical protein